MPPVDFCLKVPKVPVAVRRTEPWQAVPSDQIDSTWVEWAHSADARRGIFFSACISKRVPSQQMSIRNQERSGEAVGRVIRREQSRRFDTH